MKWTLTEKAEKTVPEFNAETIKIIESTGNPFDDRCVRLMKKLYEVSGLNHENLRVVNVPSVFVGIAVNCAADFYWEYLDSATSSATRSATDFVTYSATRSATSFATHLAALSATSLATVSATNSATDFVTYSATRSATDFVTDSATNSATRSDTDSATASATLSATDSATDSVTNSATHLATDSATNSATNSATRSATDFVTNSATRSATDFVTYSATNSATASATRSATVSATSSATDLTTDSATRLATDSATDLLLYHLNIANVVICDKLMIDPATTFNKLVKRLNKYFDYYNGGSEWASWPRYSSFVRDHCGFKHESHENFKIYEELLGYGPRLMHKNYVIVCGKAKYRHKNENNLIHNDKGPAIEWYCGTKKWYINGIKVTQQIVEFPETLSVEQINSEKNADVQRIMLDRFGIVRYITETNADMIDSNHDYVSNTVEQLYEVLGRKKLLAVDPSGEGIVVLSVPDDITTCGEAQKWLCPFSNANLVSRT